MNGLLKSTYSKNTPATTPKPENDEVQIIKEITGTGKIFDAIIIDEETKPNSGQKRTTASTPGKDTPAKKKKSSGGNDDTDTMIVAELEKRHGRGGSSLNGTYEICQAIKSFDHMGGIEKQKLVGH
uniref:BRCT domain-containing protein n=1 Tax=Rhabditophanes sp. KR3021 TaxID=114890 RepID=A0AC35UE76_9BILA